MGLTGALNGRMQGAHYQTVGMGYGPRARACHWRAGWDRSDDPDDREVDPALTSRNLRPPRFTARCSRSLSETLPIRERRDPLDVRVPRVLVENGAGIRDRWA